MSVIAVDDIARWFGVPSKCVEDAVTNMELARERQAQYEAICLQMVNEWLDEWATNISMKENGYDETCRGD